MVIVFVGVHYHFVSEENMQAAIRDEKFVEHACVHTNYYGTSHDSIRVVQESGVICILDIDIQGVKNIKSSNLESKYIFVAPPSMASLENRLRDRKTETEEKIQIRLKNASAELSYGHEAGNFDAVIINDDINRAFEEVVGKISSWYPSMHFDS